MCNTTNVKVPEFCSSGKHRGHVLAPGAGAVGIKGPMEALGAGMRVK